MTMIAGVITVVAVIVTRMPQAMRGAAPALPAAIILPEGQRARAVTFGEGWHAVVTDGGLILIYGADGTLRQTVTVE